MTLDSCDIKPVSLLNIFQKTKVLKNLLTLLFNTGARYSCVRAEYSHLGKICRRRDTSFSTPNGEFCQIKNPKLILISRNYPKAK